MPTGKVFAVPGLPGFTGIMDASVTAAAMVVGDNSQYCFLGQGPVEAEGYRNAAAGFDAWIIVTDATKDCCEQCRLRLNSVAKLKSIISLFSFFLSNSVTN